MKSQMIREDIDNDVLIGQKLRVPVSNRWWYTADDPVDFADRVNHINRVKSSRRR